MKNRNIRLRVRNRNIRLKVKNRTHQVKCVEQEHQDRNNMGLRTGHQGLELSCEERTVGMGLGTLLVGWVGFLRVEQFSIHRPGRSNVRSLL